jgi:Zn-dependent metalloprotease
MKKALLLVVMLATISIAFAQNGKKRVASKSDAPPIEPSSLRVSWPGKGNVPLAENPFGIQASAPRPLPTLVPVREKASAVNITRGENGLPIFFEGKTEASGSIADARPAAERALDYLVSLKIPSVAQPAQEFVLKNAHTDEQGNTHARFEQRFNGLTVWGSEVIAHSRNGAFECLNGRYFPTPSLASTTPTLSAEAAVFQVKKEIGLEKIKTDWSATELQMIGSQPFAAELVIYHLKEQLTAERLAWHIEARANLLRREVYFVDAHTGEILHRIDRTCNFVGHRHSANCAANQAANESPQPANEALVDGPVNGQGFDLMDSSRTFGAWQVGSQVVLEDASKPMFNSTASSMPQDPVGVIVTLDGLNTSPENQQSFDYTLVVSSSTTFSSKTAVSAHFNSIRSFDYFRNKFNRNSIDGEGGNILSFIKIAESDGSSMENAFWNGAAMWYGNGGSTFRPLARGLDVGGHEMTHGVIEKTANLEYQDESGALNESFADVFAALIDRSDWKIGEDVMQPGANPSGALRDLQDPHNGASQSSPWWQPKHTNEQYTGNQDNGGVHINSGIPNHAFYLFASNAAVGKDKAEQVYYKALRDYLVKSSKFVDCRLAVIQAATDLYGATVANVAASAFTAVGIGGSQPSGNYLGQLSPNPGTDFILCTSNNSQNLDLALGNGTVLGTVYNQGVSSRPSITDNGLDMVFVNDEGHIIGISFNYTNNPITFTTAELSDQPEWSNAAISKDGRFVAAITQEENPYIFIFDLLSPFQQSEVYTLYNPTYTQGQFTGDVRYADVLEFDYSGEYLMYDAYNELSSNQGEDISYWDIGFLQFWENGQFANSNDFFISKLFSGLPEKVSIGNPALAKNSPFIIAFDLIDELGATPVNDVYGANVETGDYDVIVGNNGTLGWPNYNRLDDKLLYQKNSYNLRLQGLAPNKIQAQGGSTQIIANHQWGVWYANGNRDLMVSAEEPSAFEAIQLSPNPTTGAAKLALTARAAEEAVVSVHDLLGKTLQSRSVQLAVGQNFLDLNLQELPIGTYIVRVTTPQTGAALKLVKQ